MFQIQTVLSDTQSMSIQFRAVCVESNANEDWDQSFETDSESFAREWHLNHSGGFFRYVSSAQRIVPRPRPRLPRGYVWREF